MCSIILLRFCCKLLIFSSVLVRFGLVSVDSNGIKAELKQLSGDFALFIFYFTCMRLLDAFIQSDLHLRYTFAFDQLYLFLK